MLLPLCNSSCNDEIAIHFTHGSFIKYNCSDTTKRLGGLLGGHVEIQIDSFVYGFELRNKSNFHWIPHDNNFNSKFTKKHISTWKNSVINDYITSVFLPIRKSKKCNLKYIYEANVIDPEYDYALFGHRCSSSLIKELNSIYDNKISNIKSIVGAFYPRQLRKKILSIAKSNNYKIKIKKGITCKYWETD